MYIPGKLFFSVLVSELMKAYTLIIGGKSEDELLKWANDKVSEDLRAKTLKDQKLNSNFLKKMCNLL